MPYKEYFDVATESLVIVDHRGCIVEVNRKTEQMFEYRADELVNQPIEVLLPERLRENHIEHLKAYFTAPRSRPMGIGLALVGRRSNGSEFPIEVSLTHAPATSRGDLVVAALTDITERLSLEDAVRRSQTLTALATFGHEVNQPLGAILNNARAALRLLDSKKPDLEDVRAALEDIVADDSRAAETVRAIRGLFERDKIEPSLVDLAEVLFEVERLVGAEAASKRIRFKSKRRIACRL